MQYPALDKALIRFKQAGTLEDNAVTVPETATERIAAQATDLNTSHVCSTTAEIDPEGIEKVCAITHNTSQQRPCPKWLPGLGRAIRFEVSRAASRHKILFARRLKKRTSGRTWSGSGMVQTQGEAIEPDEAAPLRGMLGVEADVAPSDHLRHSIDDSALLDSSDLSDFER